MMITELVNLSAVKNNVIVSEVIRTVRRRRARRLNFAMHITSVIF